MRLVSVEEVEGISPNNIRPGEERFVTDWYNSLIVIGLSAEFENLARALFWDRGGGHRVSPTA
jgi:hypothetical protein